MTPEQIRRNHFERLQGYRNSKEYAEYAREIGNEVPEGDLPSLIGDRWEIDAAVYDEFLNVLPPLGWRGGVFYLSEFTFGDITTKFTREGDRYFCQFAHYPERTPTSTPWGKPDFVKEYAPGIVSYSTPSHGGFWVSPERLKEMPEALREFVPFGGPQAGPGRWFEEDCDWTVVALSFPQYFKPEDVETAGRILKSYRPEIYEAFAPSTSVIAEELKQRIESKAR